MFEVKNNEVRLYKKELYLPKKGEAVNTSDFLEQDCIPREIHSQFINSWKAIRGKRGSKIRSVSPYIVSFYKKVIDEDYKSWLTKEKAKKAKKQIEDIKANEKQVKKLDIQEKPLLYKKILKEKLLLIQDSLSEYFDQYFNGTNEYLNIENSKLYDGTKKFQEKITNNIKEILIENSNDILKLKPSDNDLISIYFKDAASTDYQKSYDLYLQDKVLNTTAVPKKKIDGRYYGLSEFKNGANTKKTYLKHLTSPFKVNNRIDVDKAILLYVFERYMKARAFKTNPLPIFIDKTELNNNVIDVVREEGNDVKFNTIIRKLFDHSKEDLGNYYLLYFDYRGELKDLDFVSSFEFKLEGLIIKRVIPLVKPEEDFRVKNVFDFELKITRQIFSNQLVKISNDKIQYRYFDEIDNNPKYISAAQWNVVMKYRKSFYEWVYKSRRQAVTTTMFHDILGKMILDDIRADEYKDGDIETKLNIWFSLWNYFSNTTQSNELDMANKITELQKKMRLIREIKGNDHIETDEEFAFTVGQIIYFLLEKSKAGNKSHALLEPFIQKSNIVELKKAITATFNAYKHEIDFGKGRFEKLFSEIMAYELDKNLKELTPIMLAGYFSKSTIYEKSTTK